MALTKDKLIYDASSPADGDSVAAFLRTGAGALTSTNVGGKEALDVNMVNEIDVRDLVYTQDSITAHQGGTWTVGISAGQSIAVTATDLDIRDLTDATDSVQASQKGTWTVGISAGQSIAVTATDLDIRDLTAASDSVSAWTKDGAGNAINSTSNALNTYITNASLLVKDTPDTSVVTTNVSVSTSALLVSALANRRRILVQNLGTRAVYVGPSGVTNSGSAKGLRIAAGANLEIPLGAGIAMHAVAESGTQEVIVMELA